MKCLTVTLLVHTILLFSTAFCAETDKSVRKRSDAVELAAPVSYVVTETPETDNETTTDVLLVPLTTTTESPAEEARAAGSEVEEVVSTEPVQIKGESDELETLEPANTLLYGYDFYKHYQPIPVPIQLHHGYHYNHVPHHHHVKYPHYPVYHSHYSKPHHHAYYHKLFRLGPFGINVRIGHNIYRHPYIGLRKEFYKHLHLFG